MVGFDLTIEYERIKSTSYTEVNRSFVSFAIQHRIETS